MTKDNQATWTSTITSTTSPTLALDKITEMMKEEYLKSMTAATYAPRPATKKKPTTKKPKAATDKRASTHAAAAEKAKMLVKDHGFDLDDTADYRFEVTDEQMVAGGDALEKALEALSDASEEMVVQPSPGRSLYTFSGHGPVGLIERAMQVVGRSLGRPMKASLPVRPKA